MSSSHTRYYRDIGTVEFVASKRARRLNISIRHNHSIRVAVPFGISLQNAYKFVDDHLDWIKNALQHVRRIEIIRQPRFDSSFRTRDHQLVLQIHDKQYFSYQISTENITVYYPATVNAEDDNVQKIILKAVIETFREEAKQYMPDRVALLANRFGFKFNRVFIKNLKSRWGSCSARNNINLNLQLMRFDDDVIDYLILHELLHIRIKNHSRDFWQALEKIYPRFRDAREILKSAKPYIL
ncbi:MAG: M48 family metallopeptidase [Candidatus Marinimicrobia bacterium]|nr:M48 family metallopeptidase [Candidatus Neomarinimicrobiota bacterium]